MANCYTPAAASLVHVYYNDRVNERESLTRAKREGTLLPSYQATEGFAIILAVLTYREIHFQFNLHLIQYVP